MILLGLLLSLVVEIVCGAHPVETEYYNLLQVSTSATQQEIRQAYKKLAVKLHPDKNPDANEQFLKVSKAYETLKDPDKRLQYDLHGSHPTYAHRYDSHSQSEYNNLFYNGLYAGDEFVDNLSQDSYYNYLSDGFHFINFYSPFCPPCQKLSDTWKTLAKNFKDLVRVAAVNCKYQNNFCYNTMRIASYPTLLFYENAKNRRYIIYRGDHSYDSLEHFLMQYIEKDVSVQIDELILSDDLPILYIIGENWLNKNTIIRISWTLKGVAKVVKISDEGLRSRLSRDEYVTAVVDLRGERHQITSTEEEDLIRDIARHLAPLPRINTDELWRIRNTMRNEAQKPWVLYFVNGENGDRLLVQKIRRRFPDLQFGEIDCETSSHLCLSLQVESTPAWGVLKTGGAYERLHGRADLRHLAEFLRVAPHTHNLQTLSLSEFNRIVHGDAGVWVVAVIPHKLPWDHMTEGFVEASRKFKDIQFGVMMCQPSSARFCHPITLNNPAVIVQNGTRRFTYWGHRQNADSLADFIDNVMDNSGIELSESEFREVLKTRSGRYSWTIAFFPGDCDSDCQQMRLEWKIVARKLVPYGKIKIASIDCGSAKKLCEQSNIRSPILRLYPASTSNSYIAQMTSFNKAAYMLEWLLNVADDSVRQLNRETFAENVLRSTFDDPLSESSKSAWLVYFHSPRCHHCYEMYTDFFITAKMLEDKVRVGKVNCLQEYQLCNHEKITRYPSIKLYVKNNSRIKSLHFSPQSYKILVEDIGSQLPSADQGNVKNIYVDSESRFHHDEF